MSTNGVSDRIANLLPQGRFMAASSMQANIRLHQPVLLAEVLQHLNLQQNGIYVDATFGRGGHAMAILQQLGPQGRLFALDKDPSAVAFAHDHFSHDKRFTVRQGSFAGLATFLTEQAVSGQVDGILFDLGVSSPQIEDPHRGFSFLHEGPLDMRMDLSERMTAAHLIAKLDEQALATLLWEQGEERFSRRIAKAIVNARKTKPITTTLELANIISAAHPAWVPGKHPATKSFQAIRMAVNHELEDLQLGLMAAFQALKPGGKLLIISFHSLEDRIAKQFIHHHEHGDPFPAKLPIKHHEARPAMKKTSRAIKPSLQEVNRNPRSRSAVLRIGEKLT